ncbi:MAG TPA: ATP-dependent DNA ligase [Candidatus Methylacidiphilales bacterium]|nr:ATP-dependent DNA ligase [Candidatus Methylacidiphilales bacterium]
MPWQVEMRGGSIFLPQVDFWCDARKPVEFSFVSHAHFDHLAAHKRIVTSEGTRRLMAARLPGEREEIVLPFGKPFALRPDTELTLHPAGHIFGSAMLRLAREGESFLYTGDFKLRPGRSAEKCEPPRADVVVMETTFGLPRYVFPPTEEVLAGLIGFCRQAIEDGEVPVLFGYSLGKSQELLSSLAAAQLPVMLHPQTLKVTRIYEELGQEFPGYRAFTLTESAGHVVMCPPQSNNSAWLRKIKPRRTAVITGWAMDPGAVFRYQCDAAFPLSDHADYADLLRFVELVQPKRVYTVHGFTEEFARTLRERGVEAWALGQDNQLEIRLAEVNRGPLKESGGNKVAGTSAFPNEIWERENAAPNDLLAFAKVAEKIRATMGKLEKVEFLKNYFLALKGEELPAAAVAFTGRPFPASESRALNCGWAIIKGALLAVAGVSETDYRATYRRYSDSGDTTEAILMGRTKPGPWAVSELPRFWDELASRRGPLEKKALLQERLARLDPLAAKYLIKIITGDLRIGLKEGLVEEAIAAAFARPGESIREANMLSGDLGATAVAARDDTLEKIALRPFQPIHFMLASPEPTAEAVVERLGDPVWIEEKYDGIRCQVHKQGERVELYSRELRRITGQFPDVADRVRKVGADFIADGELLAWQNGRALPFAELQKRLGRKGDDFFLGAEIPVSLWLYDLLGFNGEPLLKAPLRERRTKLETLPLAEGVERAPYQTVSGAAAIEAAFVQARQRGNEGLMAKDPNSIYLPGRRGLAWLKLKKQYATLDVVVVGVEWGHGKRRQVLSDYTFAVRDERTGELLPVGKAYSGLTDAEIAHYTEYFLEHTLEERGRYRVVQPDVVLEVAFDTIQPSTRHASGYALRFPRIVRIRDDKPVGEIDTLDFCRRLADAAAAGNIDNFRQAQSGGK